MATDVFDVRAEQRDLWVMAFQYQERGGAERPLGNGIPVSGAGWGRETSG